MRADECPGELSWPIWGMGFTGLALGAMLQRDGFANSGTPGRRRTGCPFRAEGEERDLAVHDRRRQPPRKLRPEAGSEPVRRQVDRRNAVQSRAGQEVPRCNIRTAAPDLRKILSKLYPLQVGYRKRGESGIEVSDWWPHVGDCVDDLAVVRSMWTNDIDHGAQLQFHTGRNGSTGIFPRSARWVALRPWARSTKTCRSSSCWATPSADCCGGQEVHRANYLGPEHDGVPLVVDPANPLAFGDPAEGVFREEQRAEFELLNRLNRLALAEYPDDAKARARIKSYELAFRMQRAIPEVFEFQQETAATQKLYGIWTRRDGAVRQALPGGTAAGRARRAVRADLTTAATATPAAGMLMAICSRTTHRTARQVDQPIAALIRDLKQRGMLDETLVVWATEFGRSPGAEGARTAATIIRSVSPSGWPAAALRAGLSTAQPTNSVSPPSKTATTSPTSTPRCCISSASIRGARNPRPQAARNGTWPCDSRHCRVGRCLAVALVVRSAMSFRFTRGRDCASCAAHTDTPRLCE